MAERKEQQMIERACMVYIKEIIRLWKILSEAITNGTSVTVYMAEFVQDFKKAMEEQL